MSLAFEHLGNYQEAVSNRKQGAFLAPPSRNPPELSGKVGVLAMRRSPRRFTHSPPQPHIALACLALIRLPALSLFPGHNAAQLATWAEVGNCSMLTPNSATMLQAVVSPTPGNSIHNKIASSLGESGSGASAAASRESRCRIASRSNEIVHRRD